MENIPVFLWDHKNNAFNLQVKSHTYISIPFSIFLENLSESKGTKYIVPF